MFSFLIFHKHLAPLGLHLILHPPILQTYRLSGAPPIEASSLPPTSASRCSSRRGVMTAGSAINDSRAPQGVRFVASTSHRSANPPRRGVMYVALTSHRSANQPRRGVTFVASTSLARPPSPARGGSRFFKPSVAPPGFHHILHPIIQFLTPLFFSSICPTVFLIAL